MKTFASILTCMGLFCVALPAMADVHVPAGDLSDGVESLAQQTGMNIMYAGNLLDGRRTAGVDGDLSPREAFGKLLEGTSLILTEEQGALRIAKASSPVSTAPIVGSDSTAQECHRVVQGTKITRFCGSPDQWKDLQSRVGFRCQGSKQRELCASAAEWKRLSLSQATQDALNSRSFGDEARASTELNHPAFTGVQPTIGAPVTPPAPMPAH